MDQQTQLDEEAAKAVEIEVEADAEVEAEAQDTVAAEEPGEIVVTIEGEEPEVDDESDLGEKGKAALARAREAAKANAAEVRRLKAELAARAQPQTEPELKRPTMEECGFKEEVYEARLEAYIKAKSERDAKRQAEEKAAQEKEAAFAAKKSAYYEKRATVGVDDDLQAIVTDALNAYQQSVLIDAAEDPAKVVAALARNPKVLKELAAETDVHRFAYKLAKIEGKIQVTQKTITAESKLKGGGAASAGGSLQSQLERAEAAAERTGDRTEVIRIRRMMREQGNKA